LGITVTHRASILFFLSSFLGSTTREPWEEKKKTCSCDGKLMGKLVRARRNT
jgi:hypothetical protein